MDRKIRVKKVKRVWRKVSPWIGAAGSAIGIALAVLAFPPAPPKLEIIRTSDTNLTKDVENIPPVKLLWAEKITPFLEPSNIELKTLRLVTLTIKNSGGSPFDWDDALGGPLRFRLKGEGQLIAVERDAAPRIPARIEIMEGAREFLFSTPFLNEEESCGLTVLHSARDGTLEVQARAKRQGELTIVDSPTEPPLFKRYGAVLISVQAHVLGLLGFFLLSIVRDIIGIKEPLPTSMVRTLVAGWSTSCVAAVPVLAVGFAINRWMAAEPFLHVTHVVLWAVLAVGVLKRFDPWGNCVLLSLPLGPKLARDLFVIVESSADPVASERLQPSAKP